MTVFEVISKCFAGVVIRPEYESVFSTWTRDSSYWVQVLCSSTLYWSTFQSRTVEITETTTAFVEKSQTTNGIRIGPFTLVASSWIEATMKSWNMQCPILQYRLWHVTSIMIIIDNRQTAASTYNHAIPQHWLRASSWSVNHPSSMIYLVTTGIFLLRRPSIFAQLEVGEPISA